MSKVSIPGFMKDENGVYKPVPKPIKVEAPVTPVEEPKEQRSIDELLMRGVEDIYGIMRAIRSDIGTGAPSRETVQNLRDCLGMLSDLKKREKELIDAMSDEQLEAAVKAKKTKK